MMMTEFRMMMTITAQVGITRAMITGGGDGGRGLLLWISCEKVNCSELYAETTCCIIKCCSHGYHVEDLVKLIYF